MAKRNSRPDLAEAALKGALASLAGGVVMKLLWSGEQKALLPEAQQHRSPTTELVEQAAEEHAVQLSGSQTRAAAAAFYNVNMALFGAVFGVVQSRVHPPSALHGLLLGGLVYAANYPSFGVLPGAGIVPPPQDQSTREALIPLLPHVAYGLTTAALFDALT